jgi:hypothetical protein
MELLKTYIQISRLEFYQEHNTGHHEIVCIKINDDRIMTAFRFKSDEWISNFIIEETNKLLNKPADQIEKSMIEAGKLKQISRHALEIAAWQDHAALYEKVWF